MMFLHFFGQFVFIPVPDVSVGGVYAPLTGRTLAFSPPNRSFSALSTPKLYEMRSENMANPRSGSSIYDILQLFEINVNSQWVTFRKKPLMFSVSVRN